MSFFPHDAAAPAAAAGPAVEWEEADCLLCGGRNWSPLLEAPDNHPGGSGLWFFVVQCQDCGLCFTNPRPSARCIGRFYPPQPELPGGRRPHWWNALTRWLRRPHGERRLLPLHGRGRLLDCGGGESFLLRMRRHGWAITGLEPSAPAAERMQNELGLYVLHGTLPHPELPAAGFDVVTMWQTLQQAHAPLDVLRAAHGLLAPGGRLVVAVPNIDSLPFRCFGQVWYGLNLPRHMTHFAPWTLYLMLHRAGFRVGAVRMARRSGWLRSSARLACRCPQASRWHRWMKRKAVSRLVTWYSLLTSQADAMMVVAER
jgi:SAM-dependent methyltransferase